MAAGEDVTGGDLAIAGEVERLPGVGGWHVVHLDPALSASLRPLGRLRRGFVAVRARLGGTTWSSSLVPAGDGRLFLALPAHVRRAEDVADGDRVRVTAVVGSESTPAGAWPAPGGARPGRRRLSPRW